ncbi:unnamed protein product [Gordionus sp. m RMFG-2023]|uniref:putative uncharacterized protein DDB_G0282133 isoform X2 n=1 Tax=Gordionus sp. m RMFG-2023 TaxID=3053472 RepID=UPI0030E0E752
MSHQKSATDLQCQLKPGVNNHETSSFTHSEVQCNGKHSSATSKSNKNNDPSKVGELQNSNGHNGSAKNSNPSNNISKGKDTRFLNNGTRANGIHEPIRRLLVGSSPITTTRMLSSDDTTSQDEQLLNRLSDLVNVTAIKTFSSYHNINNDNVSKRDNTNNSITNSMTKNNTPNKQVTNGKDILVDTDALFDSIRRKGPILECRYKNKMNGLFCKIRNIVKQDTVNSELRLKLLELLEYRATAWKLQSNGTEIADEEKSSSPVEKVAKINEPKLKITTCKNSKENENEHNQLINLDNIDSSTFSKIQEHNKVLENDVVEKMKDKKDQQLLGTEKENGALCKSVSFSNEVEMVAIHDYDILLSLNNKISLVGLDDLDGVLKKDFVPEDKVTDKDIDIVKLGSSEEQGDCEKDQRITSDDTLNITSTANINKYALKDQIYIKATDAGRVMGVKGKRIHQIEEISNTIISFQKDFQNNEREVTICGPEEGSIANAKILIKETIRRNSSPTKEFLDTTTSSKNEKETPKQHYNSKPYPASHFLSSAHHCSLCHFHSFGPHSPFLCCEDANNTHQYANRWHNGESPKYSLDDTLLEATARRRFFEFREGKKIDWRCQTCRLFANNSANQYSDDKMNHNHPRAYDNLSKTNTCLEIRDQIKSDTKLGGADKKREYVYYQSLDIRPDYITPPYSSPQNLYNFNHHHPSNHNQQHKLPHCSFSSTGLGGNLVANSTRVRADVDRMCSSMYHQSNNNTRNGLNYFEEGDNHIHASHFYHAHPIHHKFNSHINHNGNINNNFESFYHDNRFLNHNYNHTPNFFYQGNHKRDRKVMCSHSSSSVSSNNNNNNGRRLVRTKSFTSSTATNENKNNDFDLGPIVPKYSLKIGETMLTLQGKHSEILELAKNVLERYFEVSKKGKGAGDVVLSSDTSGEKWTLDSSKEGDESEISDKVLQKLDFAICQDQKEALLIKAKSNQLKRSYSFHHNQTVGIGRKPWMGKQGHNEAEYFLNASLERPNKKHPVKDEKEKEEDIIIPPIKKYQVGISKDPHVKPVPKDVTRIAYTRDFMIKCAFSPFARVTPKDLPKLSKDVPFLIRAVPQDPTFYLKPQPSPFHSSSAHLHNKANNGGHPSSNKYNSSSSAVQGVFPSHINAPTQPLNQGFLYLNSSSPVGNDLVDHKHHPHQQHIIGHSSGGGIILSTPPPISYPPFFPPHPPPTFNKQSVVSNVIDHQSLLGLPPFRYPPPPSSSGLLPSFYK